MAGSFTLPTVLANLTAGNQPLTLIDGDLNALANPLLALGTFGNFYADTGAANAYVITVPAPQTVALAAGLPVQFLATNANTGASTLQINALAAKNILHIDGSALVPGDIPAASLITVIYDGTQFQIQSKGKANALEGVTALTGAAGTNTITATAAPTFAAYAAGQKFILVPAATNTGATTLNIGGLGAKSVFMGGVALVASELVINVPALLEYDGTQFNIIGPGYATGTWTPAVGGTATYTTQTGTYTKNGRLVTVQCNLVINAIGSGSANTISGLPFTSNTSGAAFTTGAVLWVSAASNFVYVVAAIPNNSTSIQLFGIGAAASSLSLAGVMTNSTQVAFTISYIV